jgi:hypothetical protein
MATPRWTVPGLITSRERWVGLVAGATGQSPLPPEPKHEYPALFD